MQNLVFKRLTIASDTLKSANQFTFHPKFNLITGNDNSLGKSTLAKMLFWSLGCDPELDVTWQGFDVRAMIEFNIGDSSFEAGRYGDSMYLRPRGGGWKHFPKITGEYSIAFANLVGFRALLPNRKDSSRLEVPPPAYFFLPFYVDQRRSWTEAWHSFANLEQYANWQKTIIKYHTGYLLPAFFELEAQVASGTSIKKVAEVEVRKIETAIEVVKEYLPDAPDSLALTRGDFFKLTHEIQEDLNSHLVTQEKLLHSITDIKSERQYLVSQLALTKVAAVELDKDYSFSVEYIKGDTLQCPLCGTHHDNSLASRASILADKAEAERQIEELSRKIALVDAKALKSQDRLNHVRIDIDAINSKYAPTAADESSQMETKDFSFIDALASQAVQKSVQHTLQSKAATIRHITTVNRALRKEQKGLLTKEETKDIDNSFKDNLIRYVADLRAQGVNLSPVASPLDYKKLYGSGGAAESTRGMLAYHMSTIRQIYQTKNETFSPIVIDTPNQQEQADFNYALIMEFLVKRLPNDVQFILCAMDRQELADYAASSHVITLDDDKILIRTKYGNLRPQLAFFNT